MSRDSPNPKGPRPKALAALQVSRQPHSQPHKRCDSLFLQPPKVQSYLPGPMSRARDQLSNCECPGIPATPKGPRPKALAALQVSRRRHSQPHKRCGSLFLQPPKVQSYLPGSLSRGRASSAIANVQRLLPPQTGHDQKLLLLFKCPGNPIYSPTTAAALSFYSLPKSNPICLGQ